MASRTARRSSSPTTQPSGDPPKLLFVTSFFRHHGVAFFELIVQAFLREPGALHRLLLGQAAGLPARVLEQRCLSEAPPDSPPDCPEFVLLVPGSRTGRLASTDWAKFGTPRVIRRLAEQGFLKPALAERLEENPSRLEGHDDEGGSALNLAKALEVVREARCNGHDLWPLVKECTLPDQLEWLRSHHAWAPGKAPFRIETVEEDFNTQPDERSWALGLRTWLRATVKRSPATRLVVNLGGTARHDQLAWYFLATREHDLRKAAFVSCTTPRRGPDAPLYRPLHVKPTSKDLLWELAGTKAAPGDAAPRDSTQDQRLDWLRSFKESGGNFVILLRGPRGTGKSRAVEEVWGKDIPILNCGQFGDDLNMARSELFGHVKGAFTGALDEKDGAFKQADGKALFLDEIHHLTRPMQAVLLRALQTDDENNFRYRPLGSSREQQARFQLIVGTNVSWDKLRAKLLADFIDRIYQRCVEFPAIEPGRIEAAWARVWRSMRFEAPAHDPWSLPTREAAAFKEWLMQECAEGHLAGNFRDLQRIAILCSDWQQAAHRDPGLLKPTTGDAQQPLDWLDCVKREWAASRRARQPARPSPEAVATPATREPPPVLEIACDAAQAHDPTLFLDHCKDQFARHHLNRHRTYRAAAKSLKGAKRTTEGTLRRWRRS